MKGNTIVPKRKRQINEWAETFNFDWPQNDEVTTRLRDILEREVDEKYYLSEDKTEKLVAQLEEKDKEIGTVGHHPFSKKFEFKGYNSEISPSLIATDYKAPKTVLESEPQMLGHLDMKGIDQMKRAYSVESVGPTLTTMGGGNTEPKIATLGNVSNTGHGSENVHDIGGLSLTITSRDYKGAKLVADDSSNVSRYRIRKLTPRECFRLQGFSDEVHQSLVDEGISDSQRYKMAGNAVTVNVIDAIGEKLIAYL